MTDLVDELANELRRYRHSDMASAALAEHILAIPRIHDAQTTIEALSERIAELEAALRLWLEYDDQDEADFTETGPMLLYARAIDATRNSLTQEPQ